MKKTVPLLGIFAALLFVVLVGELIYLFAIKEKGAPVGKTVEMGTAPKKLSNIYAKRTPEEVEKIMKSFSEKSRALNPVIESGAAKELILTETYKTTITKIGQTSTERTLTDGKIAHFDFTLAFATMSEKGKKEYGYVFTKEEVKRISAFQAQGDEELPVDLSTIAVGDYVSITMQTDMLANPSQSLISLKIVKLL